MTSLLWIRAHSDFYMYPTIGEWTIIIPILLTLMGWIIDYVRVNKVIGKFPKYKIIYSTTIFLVHHTVHHLTLQNLTDNDLASTKKMFYATPTTNGWKELPLGSDRLYAKKGEIELGGWIPLFICKKNKDEQRRFWITDPESPIIWRFDYGSKWYRHSSYEMFTWDGDRWKPNQWDGYYANGTEAKILGLRNYFSDKARKQIKEWKHKKKN